MRSLPIPLPLVLLALCVSLQGADPVKKPDIPTLVKQLGADSYTDRQAATAALEKAGPAALDALRKAMKSGDLEMRRRAERIVDAIEKTVYRELRKFEAHSGSVNCVCFSPDGKRALSGDHRAVRLWDVATGKELAKMDEHDDRVMAVCFSPDGKKVASGSEDRTVRLLDADKLAEGRVLRGHKGDVRAVAFSSDGKQLFSASLDGTVRTWDVATGKPLKGARLDDFGLLSLAVLPGDRQVLLCSLGHHDILCLDVPEGKRRLGLAGHDGRVMSVRLSPDGKRALTAGQDGTLRLWDIAARDQLRLMKPDRPPPGQTPPLISVSCASMSRDGKRAVSGGADMKLRIWDLSDGTLIRELTGHSNTIWSVAVSPDGKRALSGGMDGTMRLWSVGY
jgi:WD40 repeat protein